jgi:hypothetical protein
MKVEIRKQNQGKNLKEFISFPHLLFKNNPNWVAPLNMEIEDRLNPRKNPFFEHGEACFFSAWKGDQLVGRCSAQIDHEHLKIHQDQAGFFGFFDTVEDQEVADHLLRSAEEWLRAKGMKSIRGPFSLSINEETGLLVEGFEHPPAIMMPYSSAFQGHLVENAGFRKAKDLIAWNYQVAPPPSRAQKAWEQMMSLPEFSFRSIHKKNMQEEIETLLSIFNDAWKNNWGFVPATDSEAAKMASDMKLIIDEDLAFFAELNGEAVGMVVCLPNINEAIRDLDGSLFPLGWAKLLYRLKIKRLSSGRLMLLGIRKKVQRKKRYAGLSTAMYVELARRGARKGYQRAELGWTLEDNHLINLGIKRMGGTSYKRYRIYEKEIE